METKMKAPILYEVSVPFNCDEAQMESALLKFVVDLITQKTMHSVKKLFFIPVGLPGMGKSTLAKHIRQATENNLSASGSLFGKSQTHNQLDGMLPQVSFSKVSYDRILGDNLTRYQQDHPETPFHEIIDIIRGQADQDYLD